MLPYWRRASSRKLLSVIYHTHTPLAYERI